MAVAAGVVEQLPGQDCCVAIAVQEIAEALELIHDDQVGLKGIHASM